MHAELDEQLMVLAKRQDHVFSASDADRAGADAQVRYRRLKAGDWERVGAQGYKHAAAPLTWRGRLRAAVWDAGPNALISHDAAAQAYRFPGFDKNEVHVLVPKSLDHVCTIATVHESRRFELVHQRPMWGIPMVAPADTLVQLAPFIRLKRLSWLTDELLLGKKVDIRVLRAAFGRLAPSCRGMKGLRAVLHDHAPGEPVPESKLERLFMEFAETYHLPPFKRQINLPGRDQRPGRVDFFWPDVRLIVEVDGRRWHARFEDFERDHKRDLHFLALGYPTARITWTMLTEDPDTVAADLLAARAQVA
jgi:very-short-patch-repair endonuclease